MLINAEANRGPEQKINYTELAQVPSNWVSSVVALGVVLVAVGQLAMEMSKMTITSARSRLRGRR